MTYEFRYQLGGTLACPKFPDERAEEAASERREGRLEGGKARTAEDGGSLAA